MIAIHGTDRRFLIVLQRLHKRFERTDNGLYRWVEIERCGTGSTNDHGIAVIEVAHELPGLSYSFDAPETPASIARHIQDALDLAMAQPHGRHAGVLELFVENPCRFTVDVLDFIAGEKP